MDALVLNEHETKRRYNTGLFCYNCENEYYPEQGQGFISPQHLNPNGKQFCDVACQLAFAKVSLDEFDWPNYYELMCEFVGRRPYVPPAFTALQRFGGHLTIEEYKWGQQPVNNEPSKRTKLGDDDDDDAMHE